LFKFSYKWEERLTGVLVYKNDQLLTHHSGTLMVRTHLKAPYGFWTHTNNATGNKSINFSDKEPKEVKPMNLK
jgi:hypothetical protein